MSKVEPGDRDFTTDATFIIEQLRQRAAARSLNLGALLPELLIWTILRWERKVAVTALELIGVNCWKLQKRLDSLLRSKRSPRTVSRPETTVRGWGRRQALLMGSGYVGDEHLMLGALSAAEQDFVAFLAEHLVDYETVKRAVIELLEPNSD